MLAILIAAGAVALARAQVVPNEQSLKVAHETFVGAAKTGNLTLLQGMSHPRALGFFRDSQRVVELRGDYTAADALPAVLADLGRFVSNPTDTVYRVIGQTGVVCLTSIMQARKGEKTPNRFIRATYVYTAEGGNWRLASWHSSDTPLER